MANIFTVKHGSGQPNGKLLPFELGFDSTGKKLYIGGEKNADGTLGNAIPIAPTLSDLGITATTTELNYCDGVTSAIQTQLNAKAGNSYTASRALISNASGNIAASSVTSTELGYLSGVTSAIQTQLNGKQASITGAASTIASSDLTASRALISNSSGKVAVSAVTSTELGYLDGVTSAIQTQLNAKAGNSYTASRALISNASGNIAVSAVTSTELGYLDGVTSAIQTQLNGKVSNAAAPTTGGTANGTSEITVLTLGNVVIECGTFTADTTWTAKYFKTTFSTAPALSFIPVGSGSLQLPKLQYSTSVTTNGFTVSTYSGSTKCRYIAVGRIA